MYPLQRHSILLATAISLAATVLFAVWTSSTPARFNTVLDYFRSVPKDVRQLHFLLPATAANLNFCRLLLSSTITGYPDPILIGWAGHGQYDGAKSHLFKISETLAYLRALPESSDEDLVLLLDAYDVVMLMPPRVIISRYFELLESSNDRLRHERIYERKHGGADVRNTIFWGPDKTCWPPGSTRAACWAVPETPMRQKAFGPDTDAWMVLNRPRWLNSGTLIGPVKDLRDMFNATMSMVGREYDATFSYHNSDQFYFQDVWAEQEIGRMELRDGGIRPPIIGFDSSGNEIRGAVPEFTPGQRTEYHISIDYDSSLFQTAAGYTEYLTWMTFNETRPTSADGLKRRKRLDELELPKDLADCDGPFEVSQDIEKATGTSLPRRGWKDVLLGMNVITQHAFPSLHFTGDKGYRDRWWPKMWFHPHAEALYEAKSAIRNDPRANIVASVNGITWLAANTSLATDSMRYPKGGAWSDMGERLTWDTMCVNHEKDLFLRP